MTRETPSSTNIVINEQKGRVVSIVDALKYKTDDEVIEGLVATTGVDKVNDAFTKAALKDIAKQLQNDVATVDAFFMDADEDALEKLQEEQFEGTTGNVDHNNDPAAAAMGVGDPRIVPAFKLVDAKYVKTHYRASRLA